MVDIPQDKMNMLNQNALMPHEVLDAKEKTDKSINYDFDLILNVPVNISVEIGRTKITIQRLLQLNQGSVIELDRLAGEPLDIRVNGTLVAHGEAVVINDKFGIRLTDVINKEETLKNIS